MENLPSDHSFPSCVQLQVLRQKVEYTYTQEIYPLIIPFRLVCSCMCIDRRYMYSMRSRNLSSDFSVCVVQLLGVGGR